MRGRDGVLFSLVTKRKEPKEKSIDRASSSKVEYLFRDAVNIPEGLVEQRGG